jgi:hypothetical protein
MRSNVYRRLGLPGVALLTIVAVVPLAQATELSRSEYTDRAEPICKSNTEANERIFKGAKSEVRAGKLELASTHFGRAVVAFDRTIKQLKAIPQPAADQAKLTKWIGYLESESSYLGRIGMALAQGQKAVAQTLSVRLNRNSNLANNTVLAFGFDYCKINPSRFS